MSLLAYDDLYAKVKGLDAFPPREWPDHIALLYYAYHIMVGLGTLLLAVMGLALAWLWRAWPALHCPLVALAPAVRRSFSYLATTAGWMTAELGRQPWLVYGLFRTEEASRRWSIPAMLSSPCWASWGSISGWGCCSSCCFWRSCVTGRRSRLWGRRGASAWKLDLVCPGAVRVDHLCGARQL